MLLYHFLPAKYAIDDLTKKRLKLSEIDQLNDPFELSCVAQPDRRLRGALRRYRSTMARGYGMLCFSKSWHNTILWSHYADKHRGMCLGFDVDDQSVRPVSYVTRRPYLQLPLTEEAASQLLYTKYRDWSYEEEFRLWFRLDTRDPATGLYFYDLDDRVKLREVIVGPLCQASKAEIEAVIVERDVRLIKARLAFNSFRIVENLRGFRA